MIIQMIIAEKKTTNLHKKKLCASICCVYVPSARVWWIFMENVRKSKDKIDKTPEIDRLFICTTLPFFQKILKNSEKF